MSRLVPENMNEVYQRERQLREAGQSVSEPKLIRHVVLELFQAYLDNAEEGHYDTACLTTPDRIVVKDVSNRRVGSFSPRNGDFATDFKRNSLWLRIRLENEANRVAATDS